MNRRYPGEDDELWDDEIDLGGTASDAAPESSRRDDVREIHDDSDFSDDSDLSLDSGTPGLSDDSGMDDLSENLISGEPETVSPRQRRRIFGLGSHSDEKEEDDDYFDSESEREPEPKKEKKTHVLDPENPDYWIEDEPQIPSIIPKGRKRWKWWLAAALVPVVLMLACWLWVFVPYVDDAVGYGYLLHMERRGSVVKTFEGVMVPYREIDEVGPVHFEKLRFSVADDTTAAKMKAMMLRCVPVRIEYKVYHTSLPWRGEEKTVVMKADSADVSKILPPDFRRPGEVKK